MDLKHLSTGVAVLVASMWAASPALAQRSHGGGGARASGGHASGGHVGGAGSVAAPRGVAGPRVAPQAVAGPRVGGPRVVGGSRAVVGVGPYGYYRPYFYRPYYTFHPRFSIGFGLWAGYPVVFPYFSFYYGYPGYYGYPYAYDPYVYGYPPAYPPPAAYPPPGYPSSGYPPAGYPSQGSVAVQPGSPQSQSGGLSFEITPNTAEVYVDGAFVGTVATFGPTSEPLTLSPGRHHIEVRAQGFETLLLDADVTAGQVIPYKGTMQPR